MLLIAAPRLGRGHAVQGLRSTFCRHLAGQKPRKRRACRTADPPGRLGARTGIFKAEPRVSVLPDCSDARELCAYRFWTLDDISERSKSLPALIESSQHDDLLMAQLGG